MEVRQAIAEKPGSPIFLERKSREAEPSQENAYLGKAGFPVSVSALFLMALSARDTFLGLEQGER